MRKGLLYILPIAILMLITITACHQDNDDYNTSAVISINVPDSIIIDKMQGTVTVTNLNNKQSYSSSNFNGTSTSMDIMRGCYSISVTGTVLYHDSLKIKHTRNFRASSSYSELLKHPSVVSVDIIFM